MERTNSYSFNKIYEKPEFKSSQAELSSTEFIVFTERQILKENHLYHLKKQFHTILGVRIIRLILYLMMNIMSEKI